MVRDVEVKRAIVGALSRQGDNVPSIINVPTALDTYMTDPQCRTSCYSIAMSIAEEENQKRGAIAKLLCSYLVGFPPEESVLVRIEDMCTRFIPKNPADEPVLRELQKLTHAFLEVPVYQLVVPKQTLVPQFTPGETRSHAPHYASQLPSFQPMSNGPQRSKKVITVPRFSVPECETVVTEKNRSIKVPNVLFQPARCKNYTNQSKLNVTQPILEQQIKALGTYHDGYRTNATVIRATNFVMKIMCDGYVAKMPFSTHYSFLREVSLAFVSIFLKLLESEYLCVRLHVFDMLLTLGMHMQLIDTQGMFPGLMGALQSELAWLFEKITEKMSRLEQIDNGMWLAALKTCLACLPPSCLCTLDPRALRQWMMLPTVASCYPHIQSVLAEALSLKLLGIQKPMEMPSDGVVRSGSPPPSPTNGKFTVTGVPDFSQGATVDYLCGHTTFLLNDDWLLETLGPHGIEDIIYLYSVARTSSARLFLFVVLFSVAAGRLASSSSETTSSPTKHQQNSPSSPTTIHITHDQLCRTLRILTDRSLHWHFQTIIHYQSHALGKDLPQQICAEMEMGDLRDLKAPVTGLIGNLLSLSSNYRRLPDMLSTMLHITADDFVALTQVAKECCSVIPYMIREDTDFSLRRTATHLAYHCLRLLRSPQYLSAIGKEGEEDITKTIMATITSGQDRVREVGPDIIAAFGILCRTNPHQAATYAELLRLAVVKERNVPILMSIAYSVMEATSVQYGALTREGDLMSFCRSNDLQINHKSAELIGTPLFWQLYWGLRNSQMFAVQRARCMLLCILAALPQRGPSATQIGLWARCMSDPYPSAALVASLQIVRISAVSHHETYEKAVGRVQSIDPALVGNPYLLAESIWEATDAEGRVVVE